MKKKIMIKIKINSYDELVNLICGKDEKINMAAKKIIYLEDYPILNMN